jgi:hypothetical protein
MLETLYYGPADDMQGYGWALLLELSGESHYSPVNAFDDGLTTAAA